MFIGSKSGLSSYQKQAFSMIIGILACFTGLLVYLATIKFCLIICISAFPHFRISAKENIVFWSSIMKNKGLFSLEFNTNYFQLIGTNQAQQSRSPTIL